LRINRMANTTVETIKQPKAAHRALFFTNTDRQEALDGGDGAKITGKPGIFFLVR
jgi:hypothetical protein